MRPLVLLTLWRAKNAFLGIVRDPRKLLLLVAIFMLWFGYPLLHIGPTGIVEQIRTDFRFLFTTGTPLPGEAARFVHDQLPVLESGGFLVLAVIVLAIFDCGLRNGFLAYSMADVDYLFPAPVARRKVLACRVWSITPKVAFNSTFVFAAFHSLWRVAPPGRGGLGEALLAWAAIFLVFYGCIGVSMALEVMSRSGKLGRFAGGIQAAFTAMVLGIPFICWRWGLDALIRVGRSPVLQTLFFPCRLAVDAALVPLTGRSVFGPALALFAFALAGFAIVFARERNFYESALAGTEHFHAVRAGDRSHLNPWRKRRQAERKRPYAFPAFGRGGWALLWAHLAAEFKNPFGNFVVPAVVCVATTAGLLVWGPYVALPVVGLLNLYFFWISIGVSTALARQRLKFQFTLVRPLPIPAWQAVVSDVTPGVVKTALFGWCSAAILVALQGRLSAASEIDTGLPTLPLAPFLALQIVVLPAVAACLHLISYLMTLAYPNTQDKLMQFITGSIGFALMGAFLWLASPALLLPLKLGAAPWVLAAACLLPCIYFSGLLVSFSARVWEREEPASSALSLRGIVRSLRTRPRRRPEVDEALALGGLCLLLLLHLGPKLAGWRLLPLLITSEVLMIALPVALFAPIGVRRWTEALARQT